jgi:hypothetical protein
VVVRRAVENEVADTPDFVSKKGLKFDGKGIGAQTACKSGNVH